jgi:cyclopropane fatty-acyl-phospholipid synthase-like methyltransferase
MVGAEHWNDRYRSIGAPAVSWYEEQPTVSSELLRALEVTSTQSVLDVGGGASTLVDHLLREGHRDVTVLDLSAVALGVARARLGDPATVTWIEADLRTWEPTRRWDVWHDRAVLHFLVEEADRATYVTRLREALEPGGVVVVGTFAEDGPTQCSGLPVRRYSCEDLATLLVDVDVVEQRRHVHRTPAGAEQPFSWIAGRLRPTAA